MHDTVGTYSKTQFSKLHTSNWELSCDRQTSITVTFYQEK